MDYFNYALKDTTFHSKKTLHEQKDIYCISNLLNDMFKVYVMHKYI